MDDTSGQLLNNPLVEKARAEETRFLVNWVSGRLLTDPTVTPPLEALRSLLTCATIDELTNEVGHPVAWTLIDVRRAYF